MENKIPIYIKIEKLHQDFMDNKIDYSILRNEIIKILNDSNNIDNWELVNYLYATFGKIIAPIYLELFLDNPQILEFLDDINLKLDFLENNVDKKDILEYQVALLKYELDAFTHINNYEKEEMNWIRDFLKAVIYDMKSWAKEDGYDDINIKYLGKGSYFQTYRIGNEVLKIGERKHCPNNDFSYNYLVAHFSREFSENYVIEICPYTITSNYSFDDVQRLYADERDLGYCWADCKDDNMGILINDNIPRYTNLNDLGYEFLGINKEPEYYKKAWNQVIIDRDFSYNLDEYDIGMVLYQFRGGSWVLEHEKEYQKSKKK